MSFNPERLPACYSCGVIGFTTETCPECRLCAYCKKKGHTKFECPKAPLCRNCNKRGHPTHRCRSKTNQHPQSDPPSVTSQNKTHQRPSGANQHPQSDPPPITSQNNEPLGESLTNRSFRKWRSLNVSITCPPQNLETSKDMPVSNIFLWGYGTGQAGQVKT